MKSSKKNPASPENTLGGEHHHYEKLFNLVPNGLVITDPDTRIRDLNAAAASMLQIPAQCLKGKLLSDWVATSDRERLNQCMARLKFDGSRNIENIPLRFHPPRHPPLEKLVALAPAKNDAGQFSGLCWLIADKTNPVQTEQALHDSEERFRLIAENAADLIAVVNAQGQRLYNSPSYEKVLGYSQDELRANWAFGDIHPEDQALVLAAARTTFETGKGREVEYRMRHKNGTWRSLQSNAGVIRNKAGEIEELVIVAHDITDRKRIEEKLKQLANEFSALYQTTRDLADFVDLPVLLQTIIERATTLLQAPNGAIFQYDSVHHDVVLVAVKELPIPLGTRVKLGEGMIGRVAQTREPLVVDNYRTWKHRVPGQEHLPIGAALLVPMLYAGELIGVLNVNETDGNPGNVTTHSRRTFDEANTRLLSLFAGQAASAINNARLFAQVRAGRERLKRLSTRLMEAQEEERRSIARELHDEIGQALTAVQMNLQAAIAESDPSAVAPRLQDSTLTIEQVLRQVRNLSLDLHPSLLDDFGLVPALRWYANRQAMRAGFELDLIAEPLEQRVLPELATAAFRFTQEALTNIIRHAHAQHVRVELKERSSELHLLIEDDGIGFDVETALHPTVEGSGLGLLGMQERVLLVGGSVQIESAANEGTRVNATFPLAPLKKHVERRSRRGKVS